MKIARIKTEDGIFYAEVREDGYHLILGDIFADWGALADVYSGDAKLLVPTVPSKIVCLGANYKKHAEELHLAVNPEPTIFLKPTTSLIACGEDIIYPKSATRVDYESELGVIIGKECKNVSVEDALSYVFGYTLANDVTERDMQTRDGQWTRAKGFDTFCPLGPVVVTDIDPTNLSIKGIKNGQVVQDGNTASYITNVAKAVSFISGVMTLLPGDVILMGTPEGIGKLEDGDIFEIKVEEIGTLVNRVAKEK